MGPPADTPHDRFADYRAHIEQDLLGPALRNAILIFILLQTLVFIPADWVLFPERFANFVALRLVLNAVLVGIYFGSALKHPVESSVAVCAAGGAMFLAMVSQTGGTESGYYVGMILLVVGMGILTPQSSRQSGQISSMLFAGYALFPVVAGAPEDWLPFAQHSFFLGAACVEAWWASRYMESMRFSDYCQKRELVDARDELAKLDQAKSRFSANIHHELRTPLTLILAPLDSLRSGDFGELPANIEKTLTTMHSNGRRLHKMINNLLDLSKLESHQFSITRRPLRLERMVAELVSGASDLAARKGVEISAAGFDGLPVVYADEEALDKILVNLVGNALKFTSSGDRIEINAKPLDAGVLIEVRDTGIGIAPDQIESVFDRFAQADGSATRSYEGTGIGLSLAREMVELHEGRIWATSPGAGLGTTFSVSLPIGEPDDGVSEDVLSDDQGVARNAGASIAALEADLNIETSTHAPGNLIEVERSVARWEDGVAGDTGLARNAQATKDAPEVLIAEDNPDMRELLAMLVGKEFRVRTARNGREALEGIRALEPDLVLSDVMMPEMSGTELCQAIKTDERLSHIPIVLVTSKAEREMKIEGLELGADDYVTKPFHPRELLARVRSLVKLRQVQREVDRQNTLLESANAELRTALEELHDTEVQLVKSERLAAVGELAAGVAHEINNPMNFAINALRTLGERVTDVSSVASAYATLDLSRPDAAASQLQEILKLRNDCEFDDATSILSELLEIVTEGLDRTQRLVGDLRDFAAPSGGGVGEVDIERGLRTTLQLIGHAARDANVAVELSVAAPLPTLEGDATALNQVFLNLLKNATEVLEATGGAVRVHAQAVDDAIVVEIQDDGPGIAHDVIDSVFDPFFTTKAAGRGTGLGLSISRRIVDEHGGDIEVESEAGHGATFRVTLPYKKARSATQA